jgi:hypothetical protein
VSPGDLTTPRVVVAADLPARGFGDLSEACEQKQRWEFLFIGVPVRIVGGTGSPLNPVAVF